MSAPSAQPLLEDLKAAAAGQLPAGANLSPGLISADERQIPPASSDIALNTTVPVIALISAVRGAQQSPQWSARIAIAQNDVFWRCRSNYNSLESS